MWSPLQDGSCMAGEREKLRPGKVVFSISGPGHTEKEGSRNFLQLLVEAEFSELSET